MGSLDHLIKNNRQWAEEIKQSDPRFFEKLSAQQSPEYLWIGCSDSRVPSNQIVNMLPGEIFVHRNVANVVVHTDLNCLSVLQYAIDVLAIKHIIVCGHYGCGGVIAAMEDKQHGLIDNWLRNIKDIYQRHRKKLMELGDDRARADRLCELNVLAQVANVCHTTIVQNAWARGQDLTVHGWIYGVRDGLVKDLETSISGPDQLPAIYRMAVE